MKKSMLPIILIGLLVLWQAISMLKIDSLQKQSSQLYAHIERLDNRIDNEANSIYFNVDKKLKQQTNPVEIATYNIGTPNPDELTVPITYTLTPKEVSDSTIVSLDFDGKLFPMEKNGTTYTTTVLRDIFGTATPTIVIDENGVKKTLADERITIADLRESLLPLLFPRLNSESSSNDKTFKIKGTLSADSKGVTSGNIFLETRLVLKVDDSVVSEKEIPIGALTTGFAVDENVPLSDGQVCTMTLIATDSIGLEHHYVVAYLDSGSNKQPEPWFNQEKIYSADGKLLWEQKY